MAGSQALPPKRQASPPGTARPRAQARKLRFAGGARRRRRILRPGRCGEAQGRPDEYGTLEIRETGGRFGVTTLQSSQPDRKHCRFGGRRRRPEQGAKAETLAASGGSYVAPLADEPPRGTFISPAGDGRFTRCEESSWFGTPHFGTRRHTAAKPPLGLTAEQPDHRRLGLHGKAQHGGLPLLRRPGKPARATSMQRLRSALRGRLWPIGLATAAGHGVCLLMVHPPPE